MRLNTPAILLLLAVVSLCVITGFVIARKLKLKQAGYALLVVVAVIIRLFNGLGNQISFQRIEYLNINFIPFMEMSQTPATYSEYIMGFAYSFSCALAIGIFMSATLTGKQTKNKLMTSLVISLFCEILTLFLKFLGISMGAYYDTASIIFATVGCLLGAYIFMLASKMRKGSKQ